MTSHRFEPVTFQSYDALSTILQHRGPCKLLLLGWRI